MPYMVHLETRFDGKLKYLDKCIKLVIVEGFLLEIHSFLYYFHSINFSVH